MVKILFLKHTAIVRMMNHAVRKYGNFKVLKTDLEGEVPKESLDLWHSRRMCPSKHGIAVVKFEKSDIDFIYPLFFHVKELENKGV